MGSNLAHDLAGMKDLSLDRSLAIQLRSNHYPPVPLSMIEPCKEAILAGREEDFDRLIDLPEGISWRGNTAAPARAIIEGHHLEAWLYTDPEEEEEA
jgi:hypothetical protein